MRHTSAMVLWPVFLAALASAQYGVAPTGFYPDQYTGSTFTGTMSNAKGPEGDRLTLTFTKGDKVDAFTGHFETACAVPSSKGGGMMPSDIPEGTVMTAFFNGESHKGKKTRDNLILAISFHVWQGQKVEESKRKVYFCTSNHSSTFRFWGNEKR